MCVGEGGGEGGRFKALLQLANFTLGPDATLDIEIHKNLVRIKAPNSVLPCVILLLSFSVLLALRLPRLGKRELILVLFVRLFDLSLYGFVCFLFLFVSGKGCGL